jgi:hypothetical protein
MVAIFPECSTDAKKYAARVGISIETSTDFDLEKIQHKISMKSSFLKWLCQSSQELPSIAVQMLRMLLIKNVGELKNAKRWFYFSRFLRIAIAKEESRTLKANTAEIFPQLLQTFDMSYSIVIAEMRKLVFSICNFGLLFESIVTRFPCFAPMECKESDEFFATELPSVILNLFRHLPLYPRSELIKILDERREKLFGNFLIARELMTILTNDPSYITHPESYLSFCLVPNSPLFFEGRGFCMCLLCHGHVPLETLRPAIESLPDLAFSVPHTMEVCWWFYEAISAMLMLEGSANGRYETNKLQKLQAIFVQNPSIPTFQVLSDVFAAAQFTDPLGPLFGQLAFLESQFYLVYVITARYFSRMTEERTRDFQTKLAKTVELFPKKSRGMAFQQIPLRRAGLGYLLALADTDDPVIPDFLTPEIPSGKATRKRSSDDS